MLLVFRFIVIIIVISGPEASTPMPYSSIYKKCTITIFFSIFSRTLIQTRLFAFWHFSFSGFLTHNYLFNMATYMVDTLRQKKTDRRTGPKKTLESSAISKLFCSFSVQFFNNCIALLARFITFYIYKYIFNYEKAPSPKEQSLM